MRKSVPGRQLSFVTMMEHSENMYLERNLFVFERKVT